MNPNGSDNRTESTISEQPAGSGITRMFVERGPQVPEQATRGVAFRTGGHTLSPDAMVQFFEADPNSVLGAPVVRAVTQSGTAAYKQQGWAVDSKKGGRVAAETGTEEQLAIVVDALRADTAAPLFTTLPSFIPEESPVEVASRVSDGANVASTADSFSVSSAPGINISL